MLSPVVDRLFRRRTVAGSVRSRVLVIRSCRAALFTRAVEVARERNQDAEIVALTHHGHREAVQAAGADRVVEVRGRRFGLLHVRPWVVARLRAERFSEVVIPQMTVHPETHSNLYRLVAALNPERIVVLPGERDPYVINRPRVSTFALYHSITAVLARWDIPAFLAMLLVASVVRRPEVPDQSRRRRVLHVISSMGVGGAQVQLAELLNRTPADQFEVDLLVLGRSDGDFSRRWLARDDITVSYVEQWPRLALSVREIAQRCRDRRYDIVHTWLFMANMVGAAAARLGGVPIVIASVRNLSIWKRTWYRKWWFRVADALGSRAADVVTVNAQALVADHAAWAWMSPRHIRVVHNGLDPATLVADRAASRALLLELTGASAAATFVGTVGRLAPEKDQVTFLRVLAAVRATRPDLHGVVVGNGELRAQLERVAHELGLARAVTFLGERTDARRIAAGFDLFLLTSRSEGFPNVLLEATFMRVPCVATDIAGNPDVLATADALFPAGDIDAGARRVLAALSDRQRTEALTEQLRERALALFTSKQSAATWLELYRRSLSHRTALLTDRDVVVGKERAA